MRICYLSNTAIPSTTASSIQIVKMCEAFSQIENKVYLIAPNSSNIKINIFNYYNVKFKFYFKKIRLFKKFPLGISYYLFSFFSIIESIKYKPEIYITRNYFTCFILILLKKKVIMELHHDIKDESRIVQILVKYLKYLSSKFVIKIIAITNGVKKKYVKNYGLNEKKIQVLPSGSSIKKPYEFNSKNNFFKIGYFGSLYKSRGLELIAKLSRIDKKNKYYLFGDYQKTKNIKYKYKTYNDNLFFNKYVPYKDIPKNLSKMDILIMPYISSITTAGDVGDITNFTSPLKLFDYLCSGKIIICSDLNILKEVITDKKNAIFVKNFKNPLSWKIEIDKLTYQPQKQKIISKNNYDLSKKYSLKERATKILEKVK